jgi:hypothetical protein
MRTFFKILLVLVLLITAGIVTIMLVARHKKLRITANHSQTIYEPKMTTLNFPVFVSMNDIEKIANAKIKKVIIDKNIPVKGGNDTLILKVTRMGNLNIELEKGKFCSSVPLKLDIQYVKKVIGKTTVQLFREKPLTMMIEAHMASSFNMTESMKLRTSTVLQDIKWLEEPNLKILGIELNLRDKINALMLEKAPDITHKLDSLLSEKINLRKPAEKIWNKLQRSIKGSKKQKDLFIRIQPKTLGLHVDKSLGDSLRLDLIVQSKVFVRFGKDTAQIERMAFPKKVDLISKSDTYDNSKINLHCLFPLKDLNAIMRKELKGRQFKLKGLDLVIHDIKIKTGMRDIFVEVKHGGTLSGKVIMRGLPELSDDKRRIYIKHVSFENQLNDEVVNSMTDLLHEELVALMQDYSSFDIGELLESLPEVAQDAIDKSKLSKRANIQLADLSVKDLEIKLTRDNIQILLAGEGDFGISLKKDSFRILRKRK